MMQKIGDLYTGAGLYGCTLNDTAGQPLYNSSDPASTTSNEEYYCQSGGNISTTDVNDNWDRTEVNEGVDDMGSSAGQDQLCAAVVAATGRLRPIRQAGGNSVLDFGGMGFAKDGVPIIDYPLNPGSTGLQRRLRTPPSTGVW